MDPDRVLLNTPVKKIMQNDEGALVVAGNDRIFKAKKVIIATIPNAYDVIDFLPALPENKQILGTDSLPGIYAKTVLTYSEAWWREAGLVGKFFSNVGPAMFSWETSVPDLEQYSVALFSSGDIAAEWHALPDEEKNDAIVEHFAMLVGDELADRARDTLEINRMEWTGQDYIWGGPTAAMGPGMLREYGEALREPFQNLHFAGTETAYEWKGYLEGAVTAGQRAAQEVIEALGEGSED
jgi:monoamine oxidase